MLDLLLDLVRALREAVRPVPPTPLDDPTWSGAEPDAVRRRDDAP